MVFREDGTARVLIRRGKADPFGHGRTAFTSQRTAKSLRKWLGRRGKGFDDLFCLIYQGKAIKRSLSDTTVKRLTIASAIEGGLAARDGQEVLEPFDASAQRKFFYARDLTPPRSCGPKVGNP